ncbi:MAG: helix-turn-helix transcriptional regulator [Leptolyngbya sp. SIO3F4]|nr:helix-turn-helix transcriptional regulator [Leptolyngbya sp. SIO3F4]
MAIQVGTSTFDTIAESLQPFVQSSQSNVDKNLVSEYLHLHPYVGKETVLNDHYIMVALTPWSGDFVLDETKHQRLNPRKGDVSLYPAGIKGQWNAETEHQYLAVGFNTKTFAQAVSEVADINHFELHLKPCFSDPLIQGLVVQITEAITSGDKFEQLYTEALFNTLAVHLFKNYTTRKVKIPEYSNGLSQYQLDRALNYIQTHLRQNIKLADIANLLGMSQYYFCRLFRQSMGISPYKYVIQQRVEQARRLLRQPQKMSIAEIALDCGFTNQSNLCKHFRSLTGTTPKAYRRLQMV